MNIDTRPLRIVIADDHPVFRFGLRALLSAETDMGVVGEAETGDEIVDLAETLLPDVILMNLNMPGMNGIEATRQILQTRPRIGILVITMFDDDSVFAAMRAGARAYLLKGAQGEETLRAIQAVAHGAAIFSPSIASRVIQYFATPGTAAPPVFLELGLREHEIPGLVAHGYTNQAIAQRLSLSPKTVRNHFSNIFSKLQVADRAETIVRARERRDWASDAHQTATMGW